MTNNKIRFNVADLLISLAVIALIVGTIMQKISVKNFQSEYMQVKADIVFVASDSDRSKLKTLKVGDAIYCKDRFGNKKIGNVAKINNFYEFEKDIYIRIESEVTVNKDGFVCVNDKIIAPHMILEVNNETAAYTFEVISVKILE